MLARSWDRNSVCPSVCLSVTRVLCDKMKEHTAKILTPHEKVLNLVFWHQQSGIPSPWNLRLKWPTPCEKRRLWPISAYNVSTVKLVFFQRGWATLSANFWGHRPPTSVGVRKLEWLPFYVTDRQRDRRTDRRTDSQNYDPQDNLLRAVKMRYSKKKSGMLMASDSEVLQPLRHVERFAHYFLCNLLSLTSMLCKYVIAQISWFVYHWRWFIASAFWPFWVIQRHWRVSSFWTFYQ